MELDPVVLRNKGIPVELAKVVSGPDSTWEVELDESSNPVLETVWVRFTANEIADIEEAYSGVSFIVNEPVLREVSVDGVTQHVDTGETRQVLRSFNGLEGFQMSAEHKPMSTNRTVLAIVLGRPEKAIGVAMLPEKAPEYSVAITSAWAMAQGTPAESVGKVLAFQLKMAKEAREQAIAMADEQITAMETEQTAALTALGVQLDTPGPAGSPSGSESPRPEESDEASTSSGD